MYVSMDQVLKQICHPCTSEGIKLSDGGFEQVAREKKKPHFYKLS